MRRKDLESDWNNRSSGYSIRTGVVGVRPRCLRPRARVLGERAEARTAGYTAVPATQRVTASCRPSAKSISGSSEAE